MKKRLAVEEENLKNEKESRKMFNVYGQRSNLQKRRENSKKTFFGIPFHSSSFPLQLQAASSFFLSAGSIYEPSEHPCCYVHFGLPI
jgi:hypothetical protein